MNDAENIAPHGEWQKVPDNGLLDHIGGLTYRAVGPALEAKLEAQPQHRNFSGVVHGGLTMTFLDRVVGINIRHQLNVAKSVTVSLTVNFIRSIAIGDTVIGRCIFRKVGMKTIFVDAEAWVGDDLVATATGVYQKISPETKA